ncbi:MAG: hypothetical protein DMF44_10835 [Verrucomicrobia bacterium]|nr:MAG: hypothetical protein DMF44_10835 [Verrucomicrobiota bacterium]
MPPGTAMISVTKDGHHRFQAKKQYQRKQNDCDPLTRTELCQRVQYCGERRSQTLMKPCGNTVIGSPKRILNRQSYRGILQGKECVYHKKAEEV